MATKKTVPTEVTLADARKALNGPREATKQIDDLISFDPGTLRAGIARYRQGRLKFADVLAMPGDDIGKRTMILGQKLHALMAGWRFGPKVTVVVEFPEVYPPGAKVQVNPRDITWVSAAAGAFLAALPTSANIEVIHDVNPKNWKGNLTKDAGNDIAFEALFPEEQALLPRKRSGAYDDNMLDAVGIGLHRLERMRGG